MLSEMVSDTNGEHGGRESVLREAKPSLIVKIATHIEVGKDLIVEPRRPVRRRALQEPREGAIVDRAAFDLIPGVTVAQSELQIIQPRRQLTQGIDCLGINGFRAVGLGEMTGSGEIARRVGLGILRTTRSDLPSRPELRDGSGPTFRTRKL